MVDITHTKFGLNMLKRCVDIASCLFWQLFAGFICVLFENGLSNLLEFHNVLPAWSEDYLSQFWWKSDERSRMSLKKVCFSYNWKLQKKKKTWPIEIYISLCKCKFHGISQGISGKIISRPYGSKVIISINLSATLNFWWR